MWAEECQKTILPSGSSKVRSLISQSPSRGRKLSYSSQWSPWSAVSASGLMRPWSRVPTRLRNLTLATTTLSGRLLDRDLAMSRAVVSKLVPSFSFPSGRTILIFYLGISNWIIWTTLTLVLLWLFLEELIEDLLALSKERSILLELEITTDLFILSDSVRGTLLQTLALCSLVRGTWLVGQVTFLGVKIVSFLFFLCVLGWFHSIY
jgi:hypothetical protein